MITTVLYVVLALAFLVIAACLIAWVIQREPAGHGQHATRRSLDLDWDKDLPCFQPDPRFALELTHDEPHRDVVAATLHNPGLLDDIRALAATLHNPGLLDDIRTERTRNLPGPDSQVRTDASAPGWSGAQRPTSHQSAGEAHHRDWTQRPLSVVRDGLAPWVEKALAGAKVSDTVIGPLHDTTPFGQWLEQVTGGDPWNGKGSSDEYTDWLFAGMAGAR